ncbi:MAG TPA: dephospho-CoA kinase [Candidatus Hydrogenedentes bacterium]|nr:dephospho-CoA kinase [Candidatus Hydrogenedentota bacterium]
MRVIGITGGIASGKSEVARCFAELGVPVIDADKTGHTLIEPGGPAFDAVVAAFGQEVLSCGTIDRRKLGALVFADKEKLGKLNGIMYPLLWDVVKQRCREFAEAGHNVVVVDAATLCDDGKKPDWVDGLIVVTSVGDARVRRLVETRGLSPQEAADRVAAQTRQATKTDFADRLIENSGTLAELRAQATALAKELVEDAAGV